MTPPQSPVALPSHPHGPTHPALTLYGLDRLRKVLRLTADVADDVVCEEAAIRLQDDFDRRSTPRSMAFNRAF